MEIELISKHRKSLMAIAMILIALNHSYFPTDSQIYGYFISLNGRIGVDFFMFLSGFGLYYAYKKESDYWKFEKKRLLRILPYSIPMSFVLMWTRGASLKEALIHASGLSAFIWPYLTCWFASVILFIYLLTPLYLRYFNRKPLKTFVYVSGFIVLACLYNRYNVDFAYKFFRVIVYMTGIYFAYIRDMKFKVTNAQRALVIVLSFVGWIILYLMYHYLGNERVYVSPYLLITPGLLMMLACVIDKLVFIQKPLELISPYTFQFYLIHSELIDLLYVKYYEYIYISGVNFDFWINVIAIISAFIMAVLFKKLMELIIRLLKLNS